MSNKIDGYNPSQMPGAARAVGAAHATAVRPGATKDPVTPSVAAVDLKLSQDALRLQDLGAAAKSAPEVDESRVEAVRRAIADGSYKVDGQRIAGKLLDFESRLPK
jgi:negative regulator of flagellin synthesis FlgM